MPGGVAGHQPIAIVFDFVNPVGPDGGRSAGESGGRRQGQRGEEYRQGTGGRSGLGRGVSDSALLVAFVLAVLGAVLLIAAASW